MNKDTALFIRAIKCKSTDYRFKRLYSKFYGRGFEWCYGVMILKSIADKYSLMSSSDWIDGLNPDNAWKYGIEDNTNFHKLCFEVLASKIRLTAVKHFEGYPVPRRFR